MFNLLVDSLAAILSAVPGVRLVVSDPFHLVCQLFAGRFGNLGRLPCRSSSSPQCGSRLEHMLAVHFRYWSKQVGRLGLRADSGSSDSSHLTWVVCLFRWCRSAGLLASFSHDVSVSELTSPVFVPVVTVRSISSARGVTVKAYLSLFALSMFGACVLSSTSVAPEHNGDDPAALFEFNLSLRRWCRQLLGWPCASPAAGVQRELGVGDALCRVFGRAFSLFGRLSAVAQNGPRSPVPASISRLCSFEQGTWDHWCPSALRSLSVPQPGDFGIPAGSPPSSVAGWFSREVGTRVDRDLHPHSGSWPWPATSMASVRTWLPAISHLPSTIPSAHGASLLHGLVLGVSVEP